MTDLVDFVRQRLDEDEQTTKRADAMTVDLDEPLSVIEGDEYTHLVINPSRVLAEVEAKRRIVNDVARKAFDNEYGSGFDDAAIAMNDVLKLLALPYASHPEYDESWRP